MITVPTQISLSRTLVAVVLAASPLLANALEVSCALPYTNGKPGNDCNGKHIIEIEVNGQTATTVVSAQLLALDPDGNLLASLPVSAGDETHLKSRLDESDYKWRTTKQGVHQVSAPAPVLEITAVDGDHQARAYCSNIPYLSLEQPNGAVVNEGDDVQVTVAIPGVDVSTLSILVDGVDIVAALGLDPSADFPGGPFDGNVMINGDSVDISGLTVDGGGVEELASNTVTLSLSSLSAGGHVILADAEPTAGAPSSNPTPECLVDDIHDAAQFAIFGVDIFTPLEQEVTMLSPTPVAGEARHGRPITGLKINGASIDTSGLMFTPGNGETTADQYVLAYNEALGQTDLASDLATGSEPVGTLDRGSNRLTVDALDDLGNRAFAERFFAVGLVSSPVNPALEAEPLQNAEMLEQLEQTLQPIINMALEATSEQIENSFVLGLTEDAVQTLINEKCPAAGQAFKENVEAKVAEIAPISKNISGGCSCSPNVDIGITGVSINANAVSCPVDFQDGKIAVTVNLPDVVVNGSAEGDCQDDVLGVCVARTEVDITSTTTITGLSFSFDITEDQFLGGPIDEGVMVTGTSTVNTSGGVDVDCLAEICNFAIETLVTIFTFGTVDLDLTPSIDVTEVTEFNDAIGASEPDPIDLGEIDVSKEEVEQFGQASLDGTLATVEITPAGLRATLAGDFETLAIDPDVAVTPGAVVDVAPAPEMPFMSADDATVLISDDVLNQLFASMTESGGLKTTCNDTGKVVGDVLPSDCDDLSGSAASGTCHAISGSDCETLSAATAIGTAIKQGACHGARGDTCSLIPIEASPAGQTELATCNQTPTINLASTDSILLCARQDNPPRFLIQDDAATTDEVETAIRLTDLSLAIVVDRGGDGIETGDLADIATCIGSGSTSVEDCSLTNVCLDLNLITASSLATIASCPNGEPGFLTRVIDFQTLVRQQGVVCGATQETTDVDLVDTANDDPTVDLIGDNVDQFTPPLCLEGLTLGGFVEFSNPRLIAIETDGDPEFQEYIGITGEVSP